MSNPNGSDTPATGVSTSSMEDGSVHMHEQQLETLIRELRRYAIALTHDVEEADDLVQETLRRALDYGGEAQVTNWRAYLFKILHNVRNDQLASAMRRPLAVSIEVEDSESFAAAPTQEARFACSELSDAVEALSTEHREVLLLVGLEGCSYREVAEILDLPVGTVMSRLSRAREALRERFEPCAADVARGV